MPYTTAQLDQNVAKLESSLSKGYAEVMHDGQRLVYRSGKDLREAIAYFKALYPTASDAPTPPTKKTRTYFGYSNNGFSQF